MLQCLFGIPHTDAITTLFQVVKKKTNITKDTLSSFDSFNNVAIHMKF